MGDPDLQGIWPSRNWPEVIFERGDESPTSDRLRLLERFTLVDAYTIRYEVTIDDPNTWTRPWKVAFPLQRSSAYMWSEYACHEGNYGLANILTAARAAEKLGR